MIEKLLNDEEGVVDRRVAPSLLKLLHDQAALIDPEKVGRGGETGLRGGFSDRRSVIMWYQRAGVRTLGHIGKLWNPTDCVNDTTLLSALVRFDFDDVDPMAVEEARMYRRQLEGHVVIPACNQAFRDLRKVASEYIRQPGDGEGSGREVNPGNKDLDPTRQEYVAMRPGFQTLDKQQRLALEEFWDGFDDEDDLEDWILALNSPTRGEIDGDLADITIGDAVATHHLVDEPNTREARRYQDYFIAVMVLPAFIEGVKSIETGELAKATSDTPTTMRMKGGQHEQ